MITFQVIDREDRAHVDPLLVVFVVEWFLGDKPAATLHFVGGSRVDVDDKNRTAVQLVADAKRLRFADRVTL